MSISDYQFSRCGDLVAHHQQVIQPFWQQSVVEGQFDSDGVVRIAYAYVIHPHELGTIVVSPGRTEGYLKYQELIYDLYQNGYSVFVIDHRGQGLSTRTLKNRHKGYVFSYQQYLDDFDRFYCQVVCIHQSKRRYLLAHSMGAAIGVLYLQQHPQHFDRAVLSAPMFGFPVDGAAAGVITLLVKGVIKLKSWFGKDSDYFLGQQDFKVQPFGDNELTSCRSRFAHFQRLYETQPQLRLGGITYGWLAASIKALDQLFQQLDQITTPLLVLQSGQETVVSKAAQDKFCQYMSQHAVCFEKLVLAQAKHEVAFEVDQIRDKALTAMLNYFAVENDAS